MRNAIPLFKLFGIEVGLDYSWFLVFLLIVWSLTGHYLMAYPGWSAGFRLILAVVTAVLFFASVLAHEFGHSLVAIRTGVPVRRITLFIFGGVAQLTREPRRALDEFLMALAGPAVSLVLAGGFGALWLLGRLLGWQPVTVLAGWLGGIKLMLALFNLIPGFPLDGGCVFRAIVWGVTGSLTRATQIASRIGQGVAFLFIRPGYDWQAQPGPDEFRLDIYRCPVYDYLQSQGLDEFMLNSWCTLDFALAQVMTEGGYYERPHTLSAGDDVCDMKWYGKPKPEVQ